METKLTHGDIFLPLNPADPASNYLYCEVWSDGYLDGAGFGCLASSGNMAGICAASAMFAGSPFFWDPESGVYVAKEEDSAMEAICAGGADEALCKSAEEALKCLVEDGNLAAAEATTFGRMPLEEKLEAGYGINAAVMDKQMAFERFCGCYGCFEGKPVVLDDAQAARVAAVCLEGEDAGAMIQTHTCYFWDGERFLTTASIWGISGIDGVDPKEEAVVVMPLVAVACISPPWGCIVNLVSYLSSPTAADAAMLNGVMAELALAGHADPASMLFDGEAAGLLRAMGEKDALDKAASQAAPKMWGAGL